MRIVIDGAVALPLPRARVSAVPAKVMKDGEAWVDGSSEFWSALRADPLGWTTAPPTVSELHTAYSGTDPVLAVHVSGELSATVAHATEAASSISIPVRVCDSRSLSVGPGLVVSALGNGGQDLDAVERNAQRLIGRLHTYVLVDQVDYLLRSGRLGLLGDEPLKVRRHYLLGVRGHAIPLGDTRSREKSFSSLLDHVLRTAPNGIESWALSHGSAADADGLVAQATETMGCLPAFVLLLDPTVGIHVGPDAVVMAVLGSGRG